MRKEARFEVYGDAGRRVAKCDGVPAAGDAEHPTGRLDGNAVYGRRICRDAGRNRRVLRLGRNEPAVLRIRIPAVADTGELGIQCVYKKRCAAVSGRGGSKGDTASGGVRYYLNS